ncbi:MAG: hypothetical protein IM638_13875 [Bacteroidetes bacterium]|nr:hypothetical protein [Bacteroidota bacterium]
MIYEVALFQTSAGISETEALKRLHSLTPIVSEFPGFVSRRISRNSDGLWLDFLEWETMEQARKASDTILGMPGAADAFQVIDMNTLQMFHFQKMDAFS